MSKLQNNIKHFSPAELEELLGQKEAPLVLDVREAKELEICALPEYTHIPLGNLPYEFDNLDRARLIVTLCHHGRRSLQAACLLKDRGFVNIANLTGGIHAWAREIDLQMSQY